MKIIINQPRASYFVGGAEMISFDHAINFLKLKNEVYFFTINPKSVGLKYSEQFKNFYKKYSDKIHIIELSQEKNIKYIYDIKPGENRCRWNVESIYFNQKLYDYLIDEQEKYDSIFSYYILDAVFVPKKLIKKNVLYLCGIPKEQNDFQGSFLHAYDEVIAISDEVKESWEKYCKNKVKVISTGVDCKRFIPSKTKIKKNKNLIYVGRLISRKNVDKIISAFNKIKDQYPINLIIVGDGPEKEKLEKYANDRIVFTGVVQDTEKYFKTSSIFVTPSEHGEGLQGSILEAMSCGLIVVATNTKINKELLSDNRGILVEPSIDSIVKGILKALTMDDEKTAKKCRTYVNEHYSWFTKSKEILEVLK